MLNQSLGGIMSNTAKWTLSIIGSIAVLAITIAVWFHLTAPKPITENLSESARGIFYDAQWYQVLWMRWTVTDWIFGLLAAGTAVTAAVKNAFSSHNTQNGNQGTSVSTQFDRTVMLFAALSVIATTLDAKMHPAQLAERYRQGDLMLQEATMDYRHSQRTPADEKDLLVAWHQAQRILEGAPAVIQKAPREAEPNSQN
jgi:hypothetical protein